MKYKYINYRKAIRVALLLAVTAIACFLLLLLSGGSYVKYNGGLFPHQSAPPGEDGTGGAPETVGKIETAAPTESVTLPVTEPASPPATKAPESAPPETQAKPPENTPIEGYDYSKPVPECAAAGRDYFTDAVFIGNSRTDGMVIYTGLKNTTAYAYNGMSVKTIFSQPFVRSGGAQITVIDALRASPSFNKVYIMLGTNELGWLYDDIFIEKYSELLDTLRNINPSAQIYVQSIIPVDRKTDASGGFYKNERIRMYNSEILDMCAKKSVFYVDVYAGLADSEGYLPDGAAKDGIHVLRPYCVKWLEYLQTHTVSR